MSEDNHLTGEAIAVTPNPVPDGLGSRMAHGAAAIPAVGHGFLAGIFPAGDSSQWKNLCLTDPRCEINCVCGC